MFTCLRLHKPVLQFKPRHATEVNRVSGYDIHKIEQAVVHGGLFALAMARGSGKSSIAEVACIWSVLYGHREFVCLIGSDEGHACDMLESIKTELDSNDQLLADFAEVCFPIQALDGISNRANGQLFKGSRTHIGWTAKEIVLPTIADTVEYVAEPEALQYNESVSMTDADFEFVQDAIGDSNEELDD